MGWAVRVVAALACLSVASGPARSEAPRIDEVALHRGSGSVALVVTTDRTWRPVVSPVHGRGGDVQRIYVDFPAGTAVARAVPRRLESETAIRRVGLGLTASGLLRIVIDVRGAAGFAVRQPPAGHGVAVVVTDPEVAATPRRSLRVVVDPGHGGDDPGATGIVREKAVTLAIARELAALLRAGLRAEVALTRYGDESVSLRERTRRANAARADLFVSIHANASPRRGARGIETYYLDNTDDQATLRLAAIENGSARFDPPAGTSLDYILSSLVQGGKHEPSAELARHVQAGIVRRLRGEWKNVVDLGVKRGPFYVLVGAYMPCVLVEASFLTHADEGRRLADPVYQRAIAEGVYRGIASFAATRARAGTL